MDGRLYRVPMQETYSLYFRQDDGSVYPEPYGTTEYEVFDDLVIPNGKWVMERPSCGYSWLVGVHRDEISKELIDRRWCQRRALLVCDKPFGYVNSEKAEYVRHSDDMRPIGDRRLYVARQIHKGELGRGTPIPQLKFAREHPGNARKMHDFQRNRDQSRNPFRWARLSDVTGALGLSAASVLGSYWPFVGKSYDASRDQFEEFLHVRFGQTAEEIRGQQFGHDFLTFDELGKLIMGGTSLDTIWIRAGYANTLMRLVALNY